MHIPTKQPVHIHGIFSISSDRSKLHGPSDASVQDQRPNQWNATLFEKIVPQAWAKLLERIAKNNPERPTFYLWPQEPRERREMWDSLSSLLVSRASQEDCLIWYTDIGYVSLRDGLLAPEHDFFAQKKAFRDAEIPAIYLSSTLLMQARNNPNGGKLCQRTVLERLRSCSCLPTVPEESKIVLLEYLSSELFFIEIADLPLFPFEDGVLRAINENSVFLHRNASERELFKETPETNLDIGKVSAGFLERLREFAAKSATSSLRFRNPQDLHNYCSKTVFRSQNKSLDMIDGDQRIRSFVDHVWKWMASFDLNLPTLTAIGPVWLLPLTNGKYRKIQPESSSLTVTYTVIKKSKKIMQRIAGLEPNSSPLMVDSDAIPDQLSKIGQIVSKKPEFAIRNADVFVHFL